MSLTRQSAQSSAQQRWSSLSRNVRSRAAAARFILRRVETQANLLTPEEEEAAAAGGTDNAPVCGNASGAASDSSDSSANSATSATSDGGPLLLRQLRNSRLGRWECLQSLPLLEDALETLSPHAVEALETLRAAAQSDLEVVLNAAVDCWRLANQRAEELYGLQAEYDELETLRQSDAGRVHQLQRQLADVEAAWRQKLAEVVSQMDADHDRRRSYERLDCHSARDDRCTDEDLREVAAEQEQRIRDLRRQLLGLQASLEDASASKVAETSRYEDTVEELQRALEDQKAAAAAANVRSQGLEKEKQQLREALTATEMTVAMLMEEKQEDQASISNLKAVIEAFRNEGNSSLLQSFPPNSSLLTELGQSSSHSPRAKRTGVLQAATIRPVVVAGERTPPRAGEACVNVEERGKEVHIHLHQHRHCHQHAHHHKHEHFYPPEGSSSSTSAMPAGSPEKLAQPPVVWRKLNLHALDKNVKSPPSPAPSVTTPSPRTTAAVTMRAKQRGGESVLADGNDNLATMFVQSLRTAGDCDC